MEFKGTKGKWLQSHRQIPNDAEGMYATQVYDESGNTIATLAWHKKEPVKITINGKPKIQTESNRTENAKLIAAAPELLIAAQAALTILEDANHPKIDWVRGTVRNAIEKALK